MTRRPFAVVRVFGLALTLCLIGPLGPADAQSWTRPPMVDHDDKADQASEFWSGVLSGSGEYQKLKAKALTLEQSRVKEQREQALPIWEQLATLRPDDPEPHYAIGKHHSRLRNWSPCSRALRRAFEIDPTYETGFLGYQLGTCLLLSSEFEEAVKHFRALVSEQQESPRVFLRLGEGLMALGRLDDAIFSFRQAQPEARRTSRSLDKQVGYALAVALDRAEKLGESRALLGRLVSRDTQLTSLRSTDKNYAPESEEQYYLALAYEAQGNRLRSLYHFRRFLTLDPDSQWQVHAQSHLENTSPPELAVQLSVSGSAQWQLAALRKAIRKSGRPLQACVAGYPQVLATITLSGVLSRPASKHQARAAISAQADIDRDTLGRIVECLESAARRIPVPKQSGLVGGHGSAQFSILGSPK